MGRPACSRRALCGVADDPARPSRLRECVQATKSLLAGKELKGREHGVSKRKEGSRSELYWNKRRKWPFKGKKLQARPFRNFNSSRWLVGICKSGRGLRRCEGIGAGSSSRGAVGVLAKELQNEQIRSIRRRSTFLCERVWDFQTTYVLV
jgi:hypothetical protein